MTRFPKWCAAVLVAAALAAVAGCEKRPTGLDPNPNAPEGVSNPNARLLAYRNSPLRYMVRDYASTNVDSFVGTTTAFPGSPTMPLITIVDGTPANSFELYRRAGSGKFERTSDYTLQSTFKYVSAGYETFFSTDPAPGSYAPPSYLARGLVDGVASHLSPISNEGRITTSPGPLAPILYNGDLQPLDSLFVISWVGVPNATGYWIHIYEKPISALERLFSALPAPISSTTAGDILIGYRAGNNPGGSVQFRLGDPTLLTLKSRPPLLGHDYQVRVSAVDETGHIIAQTPGDLDSMSLTPDMAQLAPAQFSADKTKIFFSLGGTRVARRRLQQRGPADAAALSAPAEEPLPPSGPLVHHNPFVRTLYLGPLQAQSSARRSRH